MENHKELTLEMKRENGTVPTGANEMPISKGSNEVQEIEKDTVEELPPAACEEIPITSKASEVKRKKSEEGGFSANNDTAKNILELPSEAIDAIKNGITNLEKDFQTKLRYDQHKEKIIDNLHEELQGYKNDLYKKLQQPILLDIIHVMDDIKKLLGAHEEKDPAELDPEKLLKQMRDIPFDLEHLLYRQGVEPFSSKGGEKFDPAKQKVLKPITTGDKSEDKTIAKTIKNGYEWEGKIIRPEHVAVYVFREEKEAERAS
jgi:molecular chaperone GrpE